MQALLKSRAYCHVNQRLAGESLFLLGHLTFLITLKGEAILQSYNNSRVADARRNVSTLQLYNTQLKASHCMQ